MGVKKSKTSLGSRTAAECRRLGGVSSKADSYWQPPAHMAAFQKPRHHDLFECMDRVAILPRDGIRPLWSIVGIQLTSRANIMSRVRKVTRTERIRAYMRRWLGAGGHMQFWGWGKMGPRGGRKVWKVRRLKLVRNGDSDIELWAVVDLETQVMTVVEEVHDVEKVFQVQGQQGTQGQG